MKRFFVLDSVMSMLEILAENEYSILWELVDDFTINGHHVSIKSSTQYKSIIVDNRYLQIGGKTVIISNGKKYTPLEYTRLVLSTPV